jgi:glycerophosphoryl diester phosphodiesterase
MRVAALAVLVAVVTATVGCDAPAPNPWLSRRVLDIAHAGGEDEAPHETLFAYERAAALGAEVLDGDVRLSADGVLIVHHDPNVDTTTDGTGLVADKTYAELFALDHGYRFTTYAADCPDCPEQDYVYRGIRTGVKPPPPGHVADDFVIPRARDLFERFPDRFLSLEVEGTGAPAEAAADALVALIREFDALGRVVVSSFDDAVIDHVRAQLPGVMVSPGTSRVGQWFTDRGPMPGFSILQVPPTYSGVTVLSPQFVDDAHAAGLAVWVWMNDRDQESEAFYRAMIDMKVDGIIAAAPGLARGVIDAAQLRWCP